MTLAGIAGDVRTARAMLLVVAVAGCGARPPPTKPLFHCHILNHEDNGMMATVDVER